MSVNKELTSVKRRDLIDPELFGNEAGDDEPIEVLDSYFLSKPDFERFYSPQNKLAFVRSRKGVGKSALLKRTLSIMKNGVRFTYLTEKEVETAKTAKTGSGSHAPV